MKPILATLVVMLTGFICIINTSAFAAESNIIFKAADNQPATKLCFAAVTDNLSKTKQLMGRVAKLHGITSNITMGNQVRLATKTISCNDMNLVDFTAKYNAQSTFDFINARAPLGYRIDVDQVKIIDLAQANKEMIIMLTSN